MQTRLLFCGRFGRDVSKEGSSLVDGVVRSNAVIPLIFIPPPAPFLCSVEIVKSDVCFPQLSAAKVQGKDMTNLAVRPEDLNTSW